MARKKVFIDFDNVVYDLEKKNCQVVKDIYGVDLTPLDIHNWDFYRTHYPEVVNVWHNWDQYKDTSFFPGDVEFIEQLQAKYDIAIVTASADEIIEPKDRMIYHRYGDIQIIHAKIKHLHTSEGILIDDAVHNILGHVQNNKMPGIIVDRGYGWNQDFEHELVTRATNFDAILKILKEI